MPKVAVIGMAPGCRKRCPVVSMIERNRYTGEKYTQDTSQGEEGETKTTIRYEKGENKTTIGCLNPISGKFE